MFFFYKTGRIFNKVLFIIILKKQIKKVNKNIEKNVIINTYSFYN